MGFRGRTKGNTGRYKADHCDRGIYDQSDRRSDPDGSVPQKAGYALLFLLSLEYRICRTFTAGDPEDPAEDGNLARRTGSFVECQRGASAIPTGARRDAR